VTVTHISSRPPTEGPDRSSPGRPGRSRRYHPAPIPGGQLPRARGPITRRLFDALRGAPRQLGWTADADSATPDDLHLALYCAYELHYRGLPGVHPDWEWEPSLLGAVRPLERRLEAELRAAAGPVGTDPGAVAGELWRLAGADRGPSLSAWVAERATLVHVRELAVHRSAYQLKEADPHTWAIPRLPGPAKAVMVAIQADEYGNGSGPQMHAALFADTMDSLGLDHSPHAYLDRLPAVTLATTNVITLFGLHRRLRGALVGHLALFEMTSTGPMARYARGLERLGVPPSGRRFYDVHVQADQVHQHLAVDGMVGGLLAHEPELAADVVFGARALRTVEAEFSAHLLGCWNAGRTSLRPGDHRLDRGARPAGRPGPDGHRSASDAVPR
jgi:hypothetical protein